MKGFRPNKWALVNPPAFAAQLASKNSMATKERRAVDAILAHQATIEDIGQLEQMAECGIRAVRLARKLSYCKHLDPEALNDAEAALIRGAQAIHRSQARHERSGVYGLNASDREAIQNMDLWYGALSGGAAKGGLPRAVWIRALGDMVNKRGVVTIKPLSLEDE